MFSTSLRSWHSVWLFAQRYNKCKRTGGNIAGPWAVSVLCSCIWGVSTLHTVAPQNFMFSSVLEYHKTHLHWGLAAFDSVDVHFSILLFPSFSYQSILLGSVDMELVETYHIVVVIPSKNISLFRGHEQYWAQLKFPLMLMGVLAPLSAHTKH